MSRVQATAALSRPSASAAPEPSPSRMPRSRIGTLADALQGAAVRLFRRDVAGETMLDRGGIERVQHRRRRRDHEAIEDDRHALHARRKDGAAKGRHFATAEPAQHFERVFQVTGMGGKRGVDRRHLARHRGVVDAGAATDPFRAAAAVERGVDRRRHRGVADAHLAQSEHVDLAGHGLHAEGDGAGARRLVHRRGQRDVGGGQIERQLEDLEADAVGGADLVHRGAACGEVLQHRAGHGGRIGRDALRDDAVVAGEDGDLRAVDRRHRLVLPGREKGDELVEPAERSRRLRQLRLARAHRVGGAIRGLRHERQQRADIVERQAAGRHGKPPRKAAL